MEFNFTDLKNAVLDEILAGRSTPEVSQLLGFGFDKYKRWTDNSKILKWDEFANLCEKTGYDLDGTLEFVGFPVIDTRQPEGVFPFLKLNNAFETNQQIADYLNFHVSVIKRYSQGETVPDVETIFKMLDYRKNVLAAFLKKLFTSEVKSPLLRSWIDRDGNVADFTGQKLLYSLIEAGINISKYRTRNCSTDQWLALQFATSPQEIGNHIEKMLQYGTLKKVGDDDYVTTQQTTNLQNSFHDAIPYYLGLNRMATSRLEAMNDDVKASPRPGVFSQRVYPANQELIDKINMLIIKTSAEVLKILEEGTGPYDQAFCMLLQVFPVTK